MKKYSIIIFVIVLVFVGLYFYRMQPEYYENSSLVDTYKILSSESEWNKQMVVSDSPTSWYIENKKIRIKSQSYQGDFYCGDKKAEVIKYKAYSNPDSMGDWGTISIVDCMDYYFVFSYADNGPKLFGPFDK